MRQVLSLSLPATKVKQLKQLAKLRGYDSTSGYVKYLLASDADLISETHLLATVRTARKEYRQGKSIRAASMADLL